MTGDINNTNGNLAGSGQGVVAIITINPVAGATGLGHTRFYYFNAGGIDQRFFGATYQIPGTKLILITSLDQPNVIIMETDMLCTENCAACNPVHNKNT